MLTVMDFPTTAYIITKYNGSQQPANKWSVQCWLNMHQSDFTVIMKLRIEALTACSLLGCDAV
jgi:hypothetical protein